MALVPGAHNKPKLDWTTRRAADADGTPVSGQNRRADIALVQDSDALYERYGKPLFNLIFQWLGDYDDAQDVQMETFISAWKARDSFRGESQVYTWLYRIAHNHCKNRFKQRDRQRELEGPSLDASFAGGEGDDLPAREIADLSYSPAQLLDQKETRALIDKAIDGLSLEYKVVLTLYELEGLSYNEIADVTGVTLAAVKTRLNRARAMVRQRVEPQLKA
jgi:RNA polymerase sigma-70 factor (ECF subfamily)